MMVFIDGIKSHIGLCGGAMLAALPGWQERETGSGSKGQRGWGGFGGILAHREATVSLQGQHADTCI